MISSLIQPNGPKARPLWVQQNSKALIITMVEILVGTIGADPIMGDRWFSSGSIRLSDGIGLVPVAI